MRSLVARAAISRLKDDPELSLTAVMNSVRAIQLASGRETLRRLAQVVPIHEWQATKGWDAIAALELAEP